MVRIWSSISILIACIGIASFARATEFSSSNFIVSNPVIEELGGRSTSASFQLIGSIPYIEPARGTATSYQNRPGFLGYTDGATSSTSTTTTSASGGSGGPVVTPPAPPKPKPEPTETVRRRVDFNRDGRVDFIDFSILLYYFDKTGARIEPYDLNSDGAVDSVDISIFMYYWDGS